MKAFCSRNRAVEVGPVPLFFGFSAPAAITSAGNARISLIGFFKIEDMLGEAGIGECGFFQSQLSALLSMTLLEELEAM